MKTLINKNNPKIRITAPEIEETKGLYSIRAENLHSNEICLFKSDWTLVEEEPTCKESLQVEEEHPDNFTSFEWLVGRLMFRGCDLWGMTDGEDDNGVVTKLIKDKAVEMMELLERKLDPMAEPTEGIKGNLEEIPANVDLEKAAEEYAFNNLDNPVFYGCTMSGRIAAFKAGAEWQKKQRNKELREKIDEYWNTGYEAGVEWQKQRDKEWMEAKEKEFKDIRDTTRWVNRDLGYNDGFDAGVERAFKQFSDILDKWEAHATEGMRVGASAYHQGKITLICDLRDWMKEQTKKQ